MDKTTRNKKYIFYMHPAPGTLMYKYIKDYWECSKKVCGDNGSRARNDALKYPFHVTLTSFFCLEDESKLQALVEIAKEAFSHVDENPVISSITYSHPHISPKIGPRSNDNMSGLSIIAPSVSNATFKLVENAKDFYLRKVDDLHLTIYNHTSYKTMERLEKIGTLNVVRSIQWNDVALILWETDDTYSYWKKVHQF